MFFAGLILLIPHRIGMSRVNYVIKRYNLPISRAGLLLYKYHNNIELSLTIGTLFGNIINWLYTDKVLAALGVIKPEMNAQGSQVPADSSDYNHTKGRILIRFLMIIFLFLMLISSIIMYIIYIAGSDFGHLNAFYFSLIFLTLFDGFANAFAFALNGKQSSMLSAGIPLSGLLVTLLHYIYKFFYDSFLWDDFDYYVLRLQLICNIIIIFISLILWTVDQLFDLILIKKHRMSDGATNCNEEKFDLTGVKKYDWDKGDNGNGPCVHNKFSPGALSALWVSSSGNAKDHRRDISPIGMLAISLGTVYAFYPSIAPYSIIDFQYASIIELWILVISAITPFTFALLDFFSDKLVNIAFGITPHDPTNWYGPSGLNMRFWGVNSSPDGDYLIGNLLILVVLRKVIGGGI